MNLTLTFGSGALESSLEELRYSLGETPFRAHSVMSGGVQMLQAVIVYV
jgi:hypothetical protein